MKDKGERGEGTICDRLRQRYIRLISLRYIFNLVRHKKKAPDRVK